jgi:hypothetical protein
MSPVDRDPPASGRARTPLVSTEEQPESSDSLLHRWLARGAASQARWRAVAPATRPQDDLPHPPREQLGDDLADRWFR